MLHFVAVPSSIHSFIKTESAVCGNGPKDKIPLMRADERYLLLKGHGGKRIWRRTVSSDKDRLPFFLVLQAPSKSFRHYSYTKGDVRGVVGSEKHEMNF
jgi:hypothetical protein